MSASVPPLSNFQLDAYFREHCAPAQWGGVWCRDQLASVETRPSAVYIINLDTSKGPGTHWVGLSLLKGAPPFYFDPYGVPAPPEVLAFARRWVRAYGGDSNAGHHLHWNRK